MFDEKKQAIPIKETALVKLVLSEQKNCENSES